jgi:hypothetical protein
MLKIYFTKWHFWQQVVKMFLPENNSFHLSTLKFSLLKKFYGIINISKYVFSSEPKSLHVKTNKQLYGCPGGLV